MLAIFRRFLVMLSAAGLSACASLPQLPGMSRSSENYAAGSELGWRLAGSDKNALAGAFLTAIETGGEQRWRGRRANGVVTPGSDSLSGIFPDASERAILPGAPIDYNHVYETELGLYAVTRNANVRAGPATNAKILEVLPSGAGVDAIGRVVGAPWLLVAQTGKIRGFVHESLLIKAPGTELELAGGPHRRPVLCREFKQSIAIFSQTDAWTGAACQSGSNWRLAPEPETGELDDELSGF